MVEDKKMTDKKKIKRRKASRYDSGWKEVIEKLLEPFLEFFFPLIYKDIDFSKKYETMNNELKKIDPEGKIGTRIADELIKVYLKDGSERYLFIYIHIEVQGKKEPHYIMRVYIYNYRIFDLLWEKGVDVISLSILTDEDPDYRPDEYVVSRWGFEHRFKVPIVKLIDYKLKDELKRELETSTNPMAMVVRAQLKSYEIKKGDDDQRYAAKKELIRECYESGYGKKERRTLLRFLDWIIRLPDSLHKKLSNEIIKIEEEKKMPYVTSWERIAKREGKRQGKREGKREGIREGKLDTARRMLNQDYSLEDIEKCTGLTIDEIKSLMN
jgi:hypothetical protein